jgi:hypothetical protein
MRGEIYVAILFSTIIFFIILPFIIRSFFLGSDIIVSIIYGIFIGMFTTMIFISLGQGCSPLREETFWCAYGYPIFTGGLLLVHNISTIYIVYNYYQTKSGTNARLNTPTTTLLNAVSGGRRRR